MLTVSDHIISSTAQALIWGIAKLDLPDQRRDIGGACDGTNSPQFGRMKPQSNHPSFARWGGVPTMINWGDCEISML